MISVQEAKEIIRQNTQDFGTEEIPFMESVGRILKEDILADRDFPPFNRVAMDGIAINYIHFKNGERTFKIEGIQPAGSAQLTLKNSANCIEVMTGAVLPNNCDTVIRYEDVLLKNGIAKITIDTINANQNVHPKGKDNVENDVLIHKNTLISAAEIGVIATVGKSTVKVAKQPKVMIISTGDELVDVHENPLEYQIRKSNVYTLVSLLKELHIPSEIVHITDSKSILKEKISNYLQEYDVLLCSGAVSKGKFDFLPEVFAELGVDKLFHKVAQRPGKPFWFGRIASLGISEQDVYPKLKKNDAIVFAFPGNPIATFVNCFVYFYDWYYKSIGIKEDKQFAILSENITFKPNLTYFLQVKLENVNGQILATPIKANGSADLASLVNADGFIEIPKTENTEFKKGDLFPLIRYKK
ncbi:molybdopterin molybdotransferase MoeA [Tenacibaculum piscium]|uniref:Molybdopterin molybdenumtransferase n=1 Tax=Tenacibaculum piscium TaxID=1458515 RepID=A0A2H1YKT8_9FLAO|nr:molybdopterin molybdotransferase MoeA [Tenacibaculum piscium]MBE7629398.1 molybdopterin molybdenumtransferase MoeA [Tenacibaculum piscium]MBE7671269.1 molybdopterin molybdenumtransferase MoeA [Tenacibaculum piscium]MBE7689974.1 molybdopterin molybdenumtransferase MoeA [Tenacibaculum piscium]SOS75807.1 Molybdopterin biosynthesis protein MoeA [Tenacibaculum piscium]